MRFRTIVAWKFPMNIVKMLAAKLQLLLPFFLPTGKIWRFRIWKVHVWQTWNSHLYSQIVEKGCSCIFGLEWKINGIPAKNISLVINFIMIDFEPIYSGGWCIILLLWHHFNENIPQICRAHQSSWASFFVRCSKFQFCHFWNKKRRNIL